MSEAIIWPQSAEERNALIHEKVLGNVVCHGHFRPTTHLEHIWRLWKCDECGHEQLINNSIHRLTEDEHSKFYSIPNYTEHMDDAWKVVERVVRIPQSLEEAAQAVNTRFMLWWEDTSLWSYPAEEAAEVICINALRALGYEVEVQDE